VTHLKIFVELRSVIQYADACYRSGLQGLSKLGYRSPTSTSPNIPRGRHQPHPELANAPNAFGRDMASLATACRGAVRLSSRSLSRNAPSRGPPTCPKALLLEYASEGLLIPNLGFRNTSRSLGAQNFTMPAMSPTMTEGNIASWKVKEGWQCLQNWLLEQEAVDAHHSVHR